MSSPVSLQDELRRALDAAAAATESPGLSTAAAESWAWLSRFRDALADSPGWLALCLAVASAAVLLVLQPPFVTTFELDQRRPWRARSSICWTSLFVVVAATVAAATAAPLLASRLS